MLKKYHVTLTSDERGELEGMVRRGRSAARTLAHARVLLKCDENHASGSTLLADDQVADAVSVGRATVARVRQRFVEEGLAAALVPRPSGRVYVRKLDGDAEAQLVTLACSRPPEGRRRWTLRLLADRLVTLGHAEAGVSYETVRRTLKKTS
jgi:transposase